MIQTPIKKIALIYDDTYEYTTGFYCKRALINMGLTVDYVSPDDLDTLQDKYDLYLNIDDSQPYPIPHALKPTAYWVIDTRADYAWRAQKAQAFDFVFAAQKSGMEMLKRDGIKNVFWLPLACDPDIHKKYILPKEYDISFVGHIFHSKQRMEYLAFLKEALKTSNIFIGQASPQESSTIYAKSKLVFNISVQDDINMRLFEALSCARPLITNDLRGKGQEELFGKQPPFIIYNSKRDLLRKVKYYLNNEGQMEEIAQRGWQEAIGKHTYVHRMKDIIQTVEKGINYIKYNDHPDDVSVIMSTVYGRIFKLIPDNKKVLDIGCATGRFSKYLVKKKNCFVTGIEKDPLLSEKARRVLPEVIVGDATDTEIYGKINHTYDIILLMDILEHTTHPESILLEVRGLLEGHGQVILTTPNIAYWAIRRQLLLGRFDYNPAGGLMDNEHAHFFTYHSLKRTIQECGYKIMHFDILYDFPLLNSTSHFFGKLAKAKLIKKFLETVAVRCPNLFAHQLLFIIEKKE
jgi:spore maturation protein CgeB